jgi:hypothetical protein
MHEGDFILKSSFVNRLVVAASLSIAGILGTLTWYQVTKPKVSRSSTVLLAEAAHVKGEVLQRSGAHLLWQTVTTGKLLHEGDTIRTSENSEVRLEFLDGRYVDIDANSLVVLEQPTGAVDLDLINGNIFVGSENVQESLYDFRLKAGTGHVDLTKASASAVRNSPETLDVGVYSGKAVARTVDGLNAPMTSGTSAFVTDRGSLINDDGLVITSLPTTKPHVETVGTIQISFAGVKPGAKVTLLAGPDRRALAIIPSTQKAGENEISAQLTPGRYWWKLIAKDEHGVIAQQSPISMIEIKHVSSTTSPIVADDPVVPEPEKKVEAARIVWQVPSDRRTQLFGVKPELEMRWKVEGMRPTGYRVKLVSVAHPSEKPLSVDTAKLETKTLVPAAGRYIASIEALGDKGAVLAGSEPIELMASEAPILSAPQFAGSDPLLAMSSGNVELQWGKIVGAQKYHLTLAKESGENLQETDVTNTTGGFAKVLPGNYSVTAVAIDTYGRASPVSKPRIVKVPEVSDIQSSQLKKVMVK